MATKREIYIPRPDAMVKVVFTKHAMERLYERSLYKNLQAAALQIGEPKNWKDSRPDEESGGNLGDGEKLVVTLADGFQVVVRRKMEDVETYVVMSAYGKGL